MTYHHLKSIPKHFALIGYDGRCGECRRNDRLEEYKKGDSVTLHNTDTHETKTMLITDVDTYGCQEGFVFLSYGRFECLIATQ